MSCGYFGIKYFGLCNDSLVKVVKDHSVLTELTNDEGLSSGIARWSLKVADINADNEHRTGKGNAMSHTLSCNTKEYMEVVEKVKVHFLSSLLLRSKEQLIQKEKDNSEFGGLDHHLEDSDGIRV